MAPGDITRLIARWQTGDRDAESELFDTLYRTLHTIAVQCMRTERTGNSLGATGLVHEAYLRFRRAQDLEITGHAHFLSFAARVMRRILVDRARSRNAAKRMAQAVSAGVAELVVHTDFEAEEILNVDRALDELSAIAPRQCRLVELRYFAGYSLEEAAAILGIHPRTARRDWQIARTRLKGALDGAH
jgi:RNA polymerase sigma factor (TIGR02999 family)